MAGRKRIISLAYVLAGVTLAAEDRRELAMDDKTGKMSMKAEGGKRPARGGLAQTVTPDATLAAIVGSGAMTRAEITKKIWDYVKERNLQDSADRRKINADDKLKAVFGGKSQVTMFEMTKLVNQHVK